MDVFPEDLEYDDISENDLKAMDWINWSDFVFTTPATFRSLWEDMATTLFSTEPLQTVVLDMIEHFMSGDGSNYSNSTLTEKVWNMNQLKIILLRLRIVLLSCYVSTMVT